jgi:hypothetical protein
VRYGSVDTWLSAPTFQDDSASWDTRFEQGLSFRRARLEERAGGLLGRRAVGTTAGWRRIPTLALLPKVSSSKKRSCELDLRQD